MIYLEMVDCLTGINILEQLHNFEFPPSYTSMLEPDSPEMKNLRGKVDSMFYHIIYKLFDMLGEIDSEILANMSQNNKESWQFITFNSLCQKMHTVFGIKNTFFAKMFFLFVSGGKPLTGRINF